MTKTLVNIIVNIYNCINYVMSLFIPKNLLEESKSDQHKNERQPRFLFAKSFHILEVFNFIETSLEVPALIRYGNL